MNLRLRHGSLYSGVGGFDVAAEVMGWENVFHAEIIAWNRRALKHHFPEARSIKDVRDIYRFADEYPDMYGDEEDREVLLCERHNMDFAECECIGCSEWDDEIGGVDILTAGFPCQPFSNAGKRKGKEDERNLWPETIRIIRLLKPRWFLGENVPGIVSWNDGEVFKEIITDLEQEGYEVWPVTIPATVVGGEHRRERIWFIAHNKSIRIQGVRSEGQQVAYPLDQQVLPLRNSDGQWEVEPDVCRTNDGLSGRVDRLKAMGNAVIPQIVLQIFKTIEAYENA